MRTSFLFPLLLLLLPLFTVGQDNFQPGYVTTLSGDTLFGQIDYKDWVTNPDVIHFRDKPGGQINFFPPEIIRSFGTDNSRYESKNVHFEQSKDKVSDYPLLSDYGMVSRLVFLEVLVDGPKKLYLLHDQDDRDQFFIGSDSVPEWLTMKKYLKTENDAQVLMTDKKYIGQLLVYFQDCPGMSEKIKGVTYQEKSLTSMFHEYYNCNKVSGGFLKKHKKTITQFGLIAGVSATSISFRSEEWKHLTENDFPLSYNPSFGFFINAVIPRKLGRWSGYNEFLFTTFRVESKDLTTR
ncbi:MAG TPA: hypothetical protein VLR52_03135, partial [Bacteroidales bacterium]|nr:hypothetical protein [Bacteroidales bacterium]